MMASTDDEEFSLEIREASPAHLFTTIKSFPMLMTHGIKILESSVFEAGDYKWKLIMNIDEDEHISVKFSMVGTNSLRAGWEVNAFFTFVLYNHITKKYTCFRGKARRFHSIKSERGFSKLMSMKDLRDPSNGYLVKDMCFFGAEVFVIKNQPLIEKMSVLGISNPYKREWEIPKFSKLETVWPSETFSAGGYKWYIEMHPKERYIDAIFHLWITKHVSIFLTCVDAKSFPHGKKVLASCLFTFKNMHKHKHNDNHLQDHSMEVKEWFTSNDSSWGLDEFTAVDDMMDPCKGLLINDCCNLEIQLSVLAVQEP